MFIRQGLILEGRLALHSLQRKWQRRFEKPTCVVCDDLEAQLGDDASCPVCLVELEDDDNRGVLRLTCGHFFHHPCINLWLDRSTDKGSECPICRSAITDIRKCTHFIRRGPKGSPSCPEGEKQGVNLKEKECPHPQAKPSPSFSEASTIATPALAMASPLSMAMASPLSMATPALAMASPLSEIISSASPLRAPEVLLEIEDVEDEESMLPIDRLHVRACGGGYPLSPTNLPLPSIPANQPCDEAEVASSSDHHSLAFDSLTVWAEVDEDDFAQQDLNDLNDLHAVEADEDGFAQQDSACTKQGGPTWESLFSDVQVESSRPAEQLSGEAEVTSSSDHNPMAFDSLTVWAEEDDEDFDKEDCAWAEEDEEDVDKEEDSVEGQDTAADQAIHDDLSEQHTSGDETRFVDPFMNGISDDDNSSEDEADSEARDSDTDSYSSEGSSSSQPTSITSIESVEAARQE